MIFCSSSSSKSGFIDDDDDDEEEGEGDAFTVTYLLSAFVSKFDNKLFPLDIIEQKPGDGGRLC